MIGRRFAKYGLGLRLGGTCHASISTTNEEVVGTSHLNEEVWSRTAERNAPPLSSNKGL